MSFSSVSAQGSFDNAAVIYVHNANVYKEFFFFLAASFSLELFYGLLYNKAPPLHYRISLWDRALDWIARIDPTKSLVKNR